MIVKDLKKSFNPVPKLKTEKKKEVKRIKGKKHKQTKEKEIPKKVKQAVWERDKHKCIFCHKQVPVECACCHFIPRPQGRTRNGTKYIHSLRGLP